MSTLTDDDEEVFLDEDDILEEIDVDEEDLPDAEDEAFDEADDDSVHIFRGHSGEVYTVACSPSDPTLVATGAGDDNGILWKLGQGDEASFKLEGHNESVSCVSFSSDGQLVASGSLDGVIKVWDMSSPNLNCKTYETGSETESETGSGIQWVRWHPREHFVLAGAGKTVWMLWYAADTTVTCGDFTPDGETICTGSDDASLRIRNWRTGDNIHVEGARGRDYHTQGLTCLAITADSSLVLTGSKDGSVYIVKITTGEVVSSLSSPQWAATGSMDGKLIIWDLQHSVAHWTCEHGEGVTCLCWLGGTRYVATGCVDGGVRLWDRHRLSGECVKTLRGGHRGAVQSLAISADHNHLVSVSLDDETARVFWIQEFTKLNPII